MENLLRLSLRLDAIVSGVFGGLLVAGAPLLADVLGVPSGVLWAVGAVSLAYAGGLVLAERRPRISPITAWTVIVLNVVWAAVSVLLAVLSVLPLTGVGIAFVLLQAGIVAGLADLQFVAVRRLYPAV
jgi:hypothetical protein